jgi:hypothetical protein
MAPTYPIQLEIDPPVPQSRLTVFFRMLTAIPHVIVLYFLQIAAMVVTVIAWFAILFTGSYPRGMYGFAVGFFRWQTRVSAYQFLLTGRYPPFSMDPDATYPIRVHVDERIEGRNRLTVLIRIIMIIPHYIALALVGIAAFVVLVIAWFAALFTGMVPEGMHNFLAGFQRWSARAGGYYLLLCDEYPPFSMQ